MPRAKKIKRGTYAACIYEKHTKGRGPRQVSDTCIVLGRVDPEHYDVLLSSSYEVITVEAKYLNPSPAGAAMIDAGDTKIDRSPEPDTSQDYKYQFRANLAGNMGLLKDGVELAVYLPHGIVSSGHPIPPRQFERLAAQGQHHENVKAVKANQDRVRGVRH